MSLHIPFWKPPTALTAQVNHNRIRLVWFSTISSHLIRPTAHLRVYILQHISELRVPVAHIQLGFITRDPVKAMISLSTRSHFVLVDTVGDFKQGQGEAEQHQPEEYRVA